MAVVTLGGGERGDRHPELKFVDPMKLSSVVCPEMGDIESSLARIEKLIPSAGLVSYGPKRFMDRVVEGLKKQQELGETVDVAAALSTMAEDPEAGLTRLGRRKVGAMALFSRKPKKVTRSGISVSSSDKDAAIDAPEGYRRYVGRAPPHGEQVGDIQFSRAGIDLQMDVGPHVIEDKPVNAWRLADLIDQGMRRERKLASGEDPPREVYTHAKLSDPVALSALQRNGFKIEAFTQSENVRLSRPF